MHVHAHIAHEEHKDDHGHVHGHVRCAVGVGGFIVGSRHTTLLRIRKTKIIRRHTIHYTETTYSLWLYL